MSAPSPQLQPPSRGRAFAESFLLGGVAAGVSKTSAAPLERVKLLLQTQAALQRAGRLARPYGGALDCARRVVQHEGVTALWRGNAWGVARYFPTQVRASARRASARRWHACMGAWPRRTQALNFSLHDEFQRRWHFDRKRDGAAKWMLGNVAAGGAAGAASLVVVYPLDLARTLRATDNVPEAATHTQPRRVSGVFHSGWDVFRVAMAADGVAGLYRGFAVALASIALYRACYFGGYHSLKPLLPPANGGGDGERAPTFAASFALGWLVTAAAGTAAYPLDTLRRRLMLTAGAPRPSAAAPHRMSAMACATALYRLEGGVAAFFRGAGVNVLRAVAGAGALAGYDALRARL